LCRRYPKKEYQNMVCLDMTNSDQPRLDEKKKVTEVNHFTYYSCGFAKYNQTGYFHYRFIFSNLF
jgi:hypothetical protein